MATNQMSALTRHLRRIVLQTGAGMTDGELLKSFVGQRDEVALDALVPRHGPMVWGVCRRLLQSHHDAEDAFQATFLVFVRKAATIQRQELVANWLYGVARQTAVRVRAAGVKRGIRERQVTEMPEPAVAEQDLWHDLQPLLDQELGRLPEKYRVLIVLCDLEGKTRKEVARQLACPEGTVAGQLARARALLARRLVRHGLKVSGAALGVVLSAQAVAGSVPTTVISSTIQAANLFAAGQAMAAGVISPRVVALAEGVLKAMLLSKLKITTLVLVAVCLLTLSSGVFHLSQAGAPADREIGLFSVLPSEAASAQAGNERPPEKVTVKGKLETVDADKNSVTVAITTSDRKTGISNVEDKTYSVAKDAKIIQDGSAAKLGDLKKGHRTTLNLEKGNVVSITVEGSTVQGKFKSANVEKNTITVVAGRDVADKVYHLLKTTKVKLEGKEATVKDLKADTIIHLTLSVDGDNTVVQIQTIQPAKKRNE